MNFQNLPAQVIILLIGWAFTLLLDRKSKHRTEAIKRKDTIVSRIEDLADWIDKEITKKNFDASRLEISLAGNLTQTEMKITQLNLHLKRDLIDPARVSIIRDIDVTAIALLPDLPFKIRQASSDIIEYIEQEANDYFFKEKLHASVLNLVPFGFVVFGALMTLSIMIIVETISERTTFSTPINNFYTARDTEISRAKECLRLDSARHTQTNTSYFLIVDNCASHPK
ncbi:hypothetical protein [Pseudomonas viridiflava]|uniref:hypothetical protein n=1 Tax=Pseudomonas viridiflava TaxID=33069 RepID=UPI000F02B14A|nr:hypothetical protein [Pseudomonas viridiflava]